MTLFNVTGPYFCFEKWRLYPETGTFCGNTSMKENGMRETYFRYYRLNDFELQNMEFGSVIGDSPERTHL